MSASKIRVNIPLVKYVIAVKPAKERDRGIIPDYLVTPTIKNYIDHRDVQMELAIKLPIKIKKNKAPSPSK